MSTLQYFMNSRIKRLGVSILLSKINMYIDRYGPRAFKIWGFKTSIDLHKLFRIPQ